MLNDHAKKMPIFWGHGQDDPLVRLAFAKQSVDFLRNDLGIPEAAKDSALGVQFNTYPGLVHSANDEEVDDLQAWLEKVIPAKDE